MTESSPRVNPEVLAAEITFEFMRYYRACVGATYTTITKPDLPYRCPSAT